MPTPRNDDHKLIAAALAGGKLLTLDELSGIIGKGRMAIRSTLRGMLSHKEVSVVKPKVLPAPFKYKLRGKA